MALIPITSTTLLDDLAGDSGHARWSEFVARYRPMMVAFLHEHFHQPRTRATWCVIVVLVLLGSLSALSASSLSGVQVAGKSLFDLFDFVAIRKSGLKRDQSSPASIMRMSVEMSAP